MKAHDKLVEYMKRYIPQDEWRDFMSVLDNFDTEARRDMIRYVREVEKTESSILRRMADEIQKVGK